MLAKTILILFFCLVISNNLSGNSPDSKFFLFTVDAVPALFFASDFSLFSWLFFSLALAPSYYVIFCKTVALLWENFSLVSLIFSKIMKTNIDCVPSVLSTIWIPFGSGLVSFSTKTKCYQFIVIFDVTIT